MKNFKKKTQKMKKYILAASFLSFVIGTQAQEDYNKWSIDLSGGVNKPVTSFSSGHSTATPNLWSINGGVRYMVNNKFGVRLGGGYDSFDNKNKTPNFESSLWNVNLQGVANVGRVLNFEDWTSDLGLLAHAGVGYGQLKSDYISKSDQVAFIVAGVTPQLRISNRVTFLADASVYLNAKQQRTFDTYSATNRRGIQGVNFTTTVGLQVALGKQGKHADWHSEAQTELDLNERLTSLETNVADLKKQVDKKQDKMIDSNGNNIPDDIERYLTDNYVTKQNATSADVATGDAAADLIKKGYINVYFDFNSSTPQSSSAWAADFVAKFLKANSGASVNVLGFADELGGTNYNQTLSAKRAESVKKLLIDAGIDASRVSAEGKGVDTSVNKKSPQARQIARKATFELK